MKEGIGESEKGFIIQRAIRTTLAPWPFEIDWASGVTTINTRAGVS